jgi:hypothetical protein
MPGFHILDVIPRLDALSLVSMKAALKDRAAYALPALNHTVYLGNICRSIFAIWLILAPPLTVMILYLLLQRIIEKESDGCIFLVECRRN